MKRSPIRNDLRHEAPPQRLRRESVLSLKPQASTLNPRSGFTLVELIVVILIISILAAMLFPAINNVRYTARVAQVTVDIKNLEKAIADFKLKYGMEPPSSFLIGNVDTHYTGSTLGKNTIAIMRQLWPNYSPSESGSSLPGQILASNGVTGLTYPLRLSGAECLVFFLGGPDILNSSNRASIGFSANPANPFAAGGNRVGPFYEIDAARLLDVNGNGAPELADTLPNQTMPYQYLSSYNGRGYQPFGYDGTTSTDDEEVIVIGGSRTMNSVYLKTDTTYTSSSSVVPVGTAWNLKAFQIISPGLDAGYGPGGMFINSGANTTGSGIAVSGNSDSYRARGVRQVEADNITNFSGGALTNFYTPPGW